MKKNNIYIILAAILGVGIGYFVFSINSHHNATATSDQHNHEETQMWTCSMHPEIMQPEPGDCPICGMDLTLVETSINHTASNQFRMTKNAMALANIQTLSIGNEATNQDGFITLSGKVEVNQETNTVQASYFEGRIERLHINFEGQKIKKGQLLALIYSSELVAAQQELITTFSLKESEPSLYKAVRNKLKLWKLSEKQIDAIEKRGQVQENVAIYATVSGVVAEVLQAEGDYVKRGQPILRVHNLDKVWASFDVYEDQISYFEKGQKVQVSTKAYPEKEFNATISFIDPILNSDTRTTKIRATLNNTQGIFKPGMFITGKVLQERSTTKKELYIPASAIMWTGKRSLVYVKEQSDEPLFEAREVTIGNRIDNTYQVLKGLHIGDEIVINGTFTVDAAAQLQGKKSMMNPNN